MKNVKESNQMLNPYVPSFLTKFVSKEESTLNYFGLTGSKRVRNWDPYQSDTPKQKIDTFPLPPFIPKRFKASTNELFNEMVLNGVISEENARNSPFYPFPDGPGLH